MRARLEHDPAPSPAEPPPPDTHSESGAVGPPALLAQGLTKRWPGASEAVIDRVDLELPAGSSTWIAGRNGVGKTTLLRLLAGVLEPDEGTVRLGGLDPHVDARAYRSRVGLLSAANAGLFARLSVRRHLEYWARIAFVPADRRDASIERMLEAFALRELARRRVDRLSMGQRQRVRMALTFLHSPDLVMLDEPHNSLDDEGVAMLAEALADQTAGGGAAIWCSPSGDDPALGHTQRFTMDAGRLERR